MKVMRIRKCKDGSVILTLEMTEAEKEGLVLDGLKVVFSDTGVKVLSVAEAAELGIKAGKKGWCSMELAEGTKDMLARTGANERMKRGIEKAERSRVCRKKKRSC